VTLDFTPMPAPIVPRRRRVVWAGACATAAILVAACTTFAPHFATPGLSLTGIELLGGNLFQQDFRLDLQIHNPNRQSLPIERVRVRLSLGGEPIASGTSMRPFVVPPMGDARFEMTVSANLAAGIAEVARLARTNAPVPYAIDGVVRLDLPMFHSLPFHASGRLPLRDLCAAPCSPSAGSGSI
jgi:LEA14-like dessication related protein